MGERAEGGGFGFGTCGGFEEIVGGGAEDLECAGEVVVETDGPPDDALAAGAERAEDLPVAERGRGVWFGWLVFCPEGIERGGDAARA
jgi:hypothetical protein